MRSAIKTAVIVSVVASTVVFSSSRLEASKPALENIQKLSSALTGGVKTKSDDIEISPIQETNRRPLATYINDLRVAEGIVRDHPNVAKSYAALGITYYQIWLYYTGSPFDMNMAMRALRTMNSLDKNDPRGHLVISAIFHHTGEFKKELKELNSAIERAPKDPELYRYRSELYETLGRKTEALKDERTAKRLEKEF